MARRMRAHPWAGTALGDPSAWPASLSVACRLCLTSSFPMVLWWGPELYFLYNDAYRSFLGDKHPAPPTLAICGLSDVTVVREKPG